MGNSHRRCAETAGDAADHSLSPPRGRVDNNAQSERKQISNYPEMFRHEAHARVTFTSVYANRPSLPACPQPLVMP